MAVGAARLGFPPLISWRWTTSAPTVRPLSSKYLGRRPQLHGVFASLVEEREFFFTEPELALVDALVGIQGRGRSASPQQLKEVERAVETLENLKGIPDPTNSNLIEGLWQLMFTTRPGTASPIQKTFVGVNTFKIFQEVYLRGNDQRVINIVQFSDQIGELKVEASDDSWQVAAANGLKGLQIVKKNGNLENFVIPFPGFKLRANGSIVKSDANKFKATINGGAYLAGSIKFPFDIKNSYSMEPLYIDDKIRITRQNEDIMLIHLRISNK